MKSLNHQEMLEIIGEPTHSTVITGKYGNATSHAKGFVSVDPCYLPAELWNRIKDAHRAAYPWEGYDYEMHRNRWHEFTFDGQTLYSRDTDGDGVKFFGNCVDSGWICILPASMVLAAGVALAETSV